MKELTNFQFIWKNWVEPLIDRLYSQMDKDFCDRCNVKKRNLDELCEIAEQYYKERRKELKLIFYGKNSEEEYVDPKRMDFHKLSAILCRTLMEYKVFDFDTTECEEMAEDIAKTNTDWLVRNSLINFRVAFYTSVVFLYQSMLFKYSTIDSVLAERLRDAKKLNLYTDKMDRSDSNKVHESFENCMVLDLAKRDINNKSFDFLMYATIMYQLEEYNKLLYRYNYVLNK